MQQENKVDIMVKFTNGKTDWVSVSKNQKVKELKKMIKDKNDLQLQNQNSSANHLNFQGQPMQNSELLESYNVEQSSTIKFVEEKLPSVQGQMIVPMYINGLLKQIEVPAKTTVWNLKHFIVKEINCTLEQPLVK